MTNNFPKKRGINTITNQVKLYPFPRIFIELGKSLSTSPSHATRTIANYKSSNFYFRILKKSNRSIVRFSIVHSRIQYIFIFVLFYLHCKLYSIFYPVCFIITIRCLVLTNVTNSTGWFYDQQILLY